MLCSWIFKRFSVVLSSQIFIWICKNFSIGILYNIIIYKSCIQTSNWDARDFRIRLLLLLEIIFSQLCYFSVHLHTKEKILLHWKLLHVATWWHFSLYLKTDNPRLFKKLTWPNFFWTTWAKSSKISILPFFPKKSTLLNKKGTNFIFPLYLSYSIKSSFTKFCNFFPPFF